MVKVFILLSLFVFPVTIFGQETIHRVFYIEKSQSPNIIVYNAHLSKEGKFLKKNAIDGFWWNTEKHYRYELNWIEKLLAYGYDYEVDLITNTVDFKTKGLKKHPVKIFINAEGKVVGQMTIAGKIAYINKVYIKVAKHLYPPLEYLDLHGIEITTGKPVVERIFAKHKS